MPTIMRGGEPPTQIVHVDGAGTERVVRQIRRGRTLIWYAGIIYDCFDFDGFLDNWINELCDDPAQLIPDLFGGLTDGLGNAVGRVVQYAEDAVNQTGILTATTLESVTDLYCGMWRTPSPPEGLLGIINDLPVIGDLLDRVFGDWLTGTLDITRLIGQIPVVGQLAEIVGLIPNAAGQMAEPINYVIDEIGNVVGIISCGRFKDLSSEALYENLCFAIGAVGGAARMLVPDGLMSLDLVTSRMRNVVALPSDDGWLEVDIADSGAPNTTTQIFRRYSNDGTGDNGVGIDLRDNMVSIVRKLDGQDALVAPNLARFQPGDKAILDQTGNTHSLILNGNPVGEWIDDLGTAARGELNRSVAVIMQAASEFQGFRFFSPGVSCLRAG